MFGIFEEFSEMRKPSSELSSPQAGEVNEFLECDEGNRNLQETIHFSEGGFTSEGRFIAGQVIMMLLIAFNHSVSGGSYLYPLIPFHWRALKGVLIRRTMNNANS